MWSPVSSCIQKTPLLKVCSAALWHNSCAAGQNNALTERYMCWRISVSPQTLQVGSCCHIWLLCIVLRDNRKRLTKISGLFCTLLILNRSLNRFLCPCRIVGIYVRHVSSCEMFIMSKKITVLCHYLFSLLSLKMYLLIHCLGIKFFVFIPL